MAGILSAADEEELKRQQQGGLLSQNGFLTYAGLQKLPGALGGALYDRFAQPAIDTYNTLNGAMRGQVPMYAADADGRVGFNPQVTNAVNSAAINIGGGSLAAGAPQALANGVDQSILRMFAGPSAKTANQATLKIAQEMAANGASRKDIFNKTQWFQGVDGKWRFEIPDRAASLNENLADYGTVGQAVNHPALFEAYPQLKDVEFFATPLKTGAQGSWTGVPGQADTFPTLTVRQNATDPLSTTLHELQHGVQKIEGYAPGANNYMLEKGTPAWDIYQERLQSIKNLKKTSLETYAKMAGFDNIEDAKASYPKFLKTVSKPSPTAIKEAQKYAVDSAYQRSAGEVEARNVQKRFKQGYGTYPWETQDVTDEMQIVRGLLGK